MSPFRFTITTHTTGFHIRVYTYTDKSLITQFCKTLTVYDTRYVKGRGNVRIRKNTFATYGHAQQTYGLHIGLLADLLRHLEYRGVYKSAIDTHDHGLYTAKAAEITLNEEIVPRDYQVPIIDFIVKAERIAVLPIQTGRGKTLMTLMALAILKVRAVLVMDAMHTDTWIKEIDKALVGGVKKLTKVVSGSRNLKKLIKKALEEDHTPPIVIITVTTLRNYLTEYEVEGKSSYGVDPIDLFKLLKTGIKVIDEADSALHFQFRQAIETNVIKTVYLSATMQSNDAFTNRMYRLIFPPIHRYTNLSPTKYIKVTALGYRHLDPTDVKCTSMRRYNHTAYEGWLEKTSDRRERYFKMCQFVIDKGWLKDRKDGDKLLIFVATISLSVKLANYLKQHYTDITIESYTGKDVATELYRYDVVVTTPGSAGRGKDIAGLTTVISTVAISSKERNQQMLGRLRPIEGRVPHYIYMVAMDIKQPVRYHKEKIDVFAGLVTSQSYINTTYVI